MNIYFRCDSTLDIGTGHTFRCLALADALKKDATEILFFCRKDPADLSSIIAERGYRVVDMPWFAPIEGFDLARGNASYEQTEFEAEDLLFLTKWVSENITKDLLESSLLVVDHYMLGIPWQEGIRRVFGKLVVIDDLLDIPHHGDLVVDPNMRLPSELDDYVLSLPEASNFVSGSQYLFIRESLRGFRKIAFNRMLDRRGIEKVLVMFGGSDVQNFTKIAVEGCLKVEGVHVHVVLGFNNGNRIGLVSRYADTHRVTIHPFLREPGEIMAVCDVGIGALGTITWERCFLGLPSLIYTNQPSQKKFVNYLASKGIVIDLGLKYSSDAVALQLAELKSGVSHHIALRERLFSFFDGNGINNIKKKIYEIR